MSIAMPSGRIPGRYPYLAVRAMIALVVSMLALAIPMASPASAEHDEDHVPLARLQLEVHDIYVRDDWDALSSGELHFQFYFWRQTQHCDDCLREGRFLNFSVTADTGYVVTVKEVVPDGGLAFYPGDLLGVTIGFWEEDSGLEGLFGVGVENEPARHRILPIQLALDEMDQWLGLDGEHFSATIRWRKAPLPDLRVAQIWTRPDPVAAGQHFEFCARVVNEGHGSAGRYRLAFDAPANSQEVNLPGLAQGASADVCRNVQTEYPRGEHTLTVTVDSLRQVPEEDERNNLATDVMYAGASLPAPADLRVVDIWTRPDPPIAESSTEICARVYNSGSTPSYQFFVLFMLDYVWVGESSVPKLEPAKTVDTCVLIAARGGDRTVMVDADSRRAIAEPDEADNYREELITWVAVVSSSAPPPVNPALRPDLTVAELVIQTFDRNAQNGSSDCDPGRNLLTAVVRNIGQAESGRSVVRLKIDGQDRRDLDQVLPALPPDGLARIGFPAIELSAGTHQTIVTADPDRQVDESSERNNELQMAVHCVTEANRAR